MKRTLVIVMAVALIAGCQQQNKYYDYRLKLENKTTKSIIAYTSYAYPDTMLGAILPKGVEANNQMAAPGGAITFVRGGTWETAFRDDIPFGKMMMFVLDKQITDSLPWDSIRQHNLILKRFDLTLDSLQAHGFRVTLE